MENHADPTTLSAGWNRRRFLQLGAASAVGAAVLAACSGTSNPTSRIGTVPPTTSLPTGDVTDPVLARTATSLEHLLVAAYDAVASQNLLSGTAAAVAAKMHDQHVENAATLAELTSMVGGDPYECANGRMNALYLEPALQYILGSAAAESGLGIAAPATEIAASPDQAGDTLVLLNALETITAATHQAYVNMLNSVELRAAGMEIGVGSARRGALWGALVNPDALVDDAVLAGVPTVVTTTTAAPAADEDETATTEAPADPTGPAPIVHAVSASFGQLGPVLIEIGAEDENGIRKKVNIETPYLNSLAYDYQSCEA